MACDQEIEKKPTLCFFHKLPGAREKPISSCKSRISGLLVQTKLKWFGCWRKFISAQEILGLNPGYHQSLSLRGTIIIIQNVFLRFPLVLFLQQEILDCDNPFSPSIPWPQRDLKFCFQSEKSQWIFQQAQQGGIFSLPQRHLRLLQLWKFICLSVQQFLFWCFCHGLFPLVKELLINPFNAENLLAHRNGVCCPVSVLKMSKSSRER